MNDTIFTPMDLRWDEFTNSLTFHLNVRGHPDNDEWVMSDCDGTFRLCKNILSARYPEVDVESTLTYFKQMGWFCDCDIFYGCPFGLGEPKIANAIDNR